MVQSTFTKLLEDFAELLDATDEEDFTEELLLDLTLDEEFTEELELSFLLLEESPVFTELELLESDEFFVSFAELLDTSTGSDPLTLLEDLSRFSVVAEDDIREELLDSRSGSGMTEEDDSSSSTAELCALFSPDALVEPESSPQALKANSAKATALTKPIFLKVFIKNSENIFPINLDSYNAFTPPECKFY